MQLVVLLWTLIQASWLVAASSASSGLNSSTMNTKHIGTASLLTCMENSQFTASFFEVLFFPDTKMVQLNIDATTTIQANITADIQVIVYGLNIMETTIDLCKLGDEKSLCPLQAGRIEIDYTYGPLSSSLIDQLPGVTYTIPDLDAQVRVMVYSTADTDSKNPLACVVAPLTNGKTVQTKYASWPIAAVSGLGVLTSGFVSVLGHSTTAAHIASNSISLFIYFQNLAITSMMGVSRVPPIAAAWSQNFQWSMGIINAKFMQDIFNWYVQATGGDPVVVVANKDVLSISVQKKRFKRAVVDGAKHLYKRISVSTSDSFDVSSFLNQTSLYTTNERNSTNYASKTLVLHGIQRVAFKAGIELSNLFLTGVVFTFFFIFVVVVALMFFKALVELLTRARVMAESSKFFEYRKGWVSIIKGTLFRLCIIAFPQLSILSIWEFTQRDSPAVVVDAVAVLLVVTGILFYGVTRVILRGRESARLYKTPAYMLFGDSVFLNKYGFLYVQFKADMYWWLIPFLTYALLRSIFVAVLQDYGRAQALVVFIIELIYFVALCWKRPYLDKRTNAFNIVIHLVNFFNAIFFLFFSGLFKQPQVVSSVMAIVLFVLNAVFALFLLIFTIVTCTLALIHRNPDTRYQPMKDDRVSFIPKIQTNGSASKSETELFELGKAAMITNEATQYPSSGESSKNKSSKKLLFDDEVDDSSHFDMLSESREKRAYSGEPQALQPGSAVLGTSTFGNPYQKVPTAPSSRSAQNLRAPENTFNSNTSYQGYVGSSNPYTKGQSYL
ncbi:LANO_0C00804g1_1 [Lachancea nothofagi CBS 11611]|uniref:LANO_0C00804g1_1 n=1 Tax=Lachancea nothofagi CBS 11611 TaxID=1266666 RepID=A0A1G4J3C8_9SACH|nr:LANO_0C00804g1_1 [Lachancea nothofagi CBS 11611]